MNNEVFSHLKTGVYTVEIKCLEEVRFPLYMGSTLRGAFGWALKQVCCALRRQQCSTCLLRNRCAYVYVFETPPPADAEMMRLYPAAPHPFVLEPPDFSHDHCLQEGDTLSFNLVMVGRALDYLPYFTYALVRLGERGLGRGRARFTLDEVHAATALGRRRIYDGNGGSLDMPEPFPMASDIRMRVEKLGGAETLTLRFLTPTRIKYQGRLQDTPEFHHLVRSLLRRLSTLSYFHCGQRLELDFRGMIRRAEGIRQVSTQLHWYDWQRYSNRQKQHMKLGGFLGSATYEGDVQEFLPLLAWGEILHVGKGASFGLGKYELQEG